MSESKQAVLPLWGSAANAKAVHFEAVERFEALCGEWLAANLDRNEAEMDRVLGELRAVVASMNEFQRAQFRKWAKEREAQRR